MLSGNQLRQKYLDFFVAHGHKIIPSAPIVLANDPTTLFTGSGMQPMMPYLLGAPHPLGTRLTDSQKCFRAGDIEEVGDNRHQTFFEMLGNWSLGDYFKGEQLAWIWEFYTSQLGLPKENLHVSLFAGNDRVSRDEESAQIWQKLGVSDDHIHYYDAKKNWWSRSGTPDQMPVGEPGGPDSEVFYDFGTPHDPKFGESCHPNCDCGRFLEIGNSVFMLYQKQTDGSLQELTQKNVDFGGGLERILAAIHHDPDVYKTDLFWPIIEKIETLTKLKYSDNSSAMRIICDHLKGSVMMIAEGLEPSNKQQGYLLRRLLRRAALKVFRMKPDAKSADFDAIIETIFAVYEGVYLDRLKEFDSVSQIIKQEFEKFQRTVNRGLSVLEKIEKINGKIAFDMLSTFGFPWELTLELADERGQKVDRGQFEIEFKKHQDTSRTASTGMFKGGLADHSEVVTQYHTATHLLHQALRDVLGISVHQAGSNLTAERLRFDFSYDKALTPEELQKVENSVNEKIERNLPVTAATMPYDEAMKSGALAFFKEKYPDQVTVYTIGDYSRELCGGPHVCHTSEIGKIKIVKQESLGSSLRRLYLTKVS
ncbi:alanine--tRNA ligase [Candidatus Collierbacteria bacterium]|nr:alanine--tRNA ligase [Candidatus Collierbacteria bacterium]